MNIANETHVIAKTSLDALGKLVEREWEAYPQSLLPYPKATIKAAIKDYLHTHPTMSPSERALVNVKYIFLAEFVADEDAALVNSANFRFNPDMLFKQEIRVVALPGDYLKRCNAIRDRQNQERQALVEEITHI